MTAHIRGSVHVPLAVGAGTGPTEAAPVAATHVVARLDVNDGGVAGFLRRARRMTVAASAHGPTSAVTALEPEATTNTGDRAAFEAAMAAHNAARELYEAEAGPYWTDATAKRRARGTKPIANFADADFVIVAPPQHTGPAKPREADFGLTTEDDQGSTSTIPSVADYLKYAHDEFGFTPDRVSEKQFKTQYARRALAAGLSKDQVVGVYTFETGGRGRHDIQSGINPDTGTGTPRSSALGYVQMVNANSIALIARHGIRIADELTAKGKPAKAQIVLQMAARMRGFSNVQQLRANANNETGMPNWSKAVKMSNTAAGRAVHAINLDGDIGPRVQVIQLADTLRLFHNFAKKNPIPGGWGQPSPATLELMNLAGPTNGFAMAHPAARNRLTVNFFTRRGYERNPIVSKRLADGTRVPRTAGELLAAIDAIIHGNNRNRPAAKELAAAFDAASVDGGDGTTEPAG